MNENETIECDGSDAVNWSARSPYLRLLDFSLWGFMNEKCCYTYVLKKNRIMRNARRMITSELL